MQNQPTDLLDQITLEKSNAKPTTCLWIWTKLCTEGPLPIEHQQLLHGDHYEL